MKETQLFDFQNKEYLTLTEAAQWASKFLNRNISKSNISYLIQYGRLNKYQSGGTVVVRLQELKLYYEQQKKLENKWKSSLGEDLNWHLSFAEYKESERTKHVHRLHPYKGKFIPQLVEYFLDSHTDEFKTQTFFKPGDIVLDPFCGSGTTLVQANELGIHAIGIDISEFNVLIGNIKVRKHNLIALRLAIDELTYKLKKFQTQHTNLQFEQELTDKLNEFNNVYFPSPDYKIKLKQKIINEKQYGQQKLKEFLPVYDSLIKKYNIKIKQERDSSFLDKWYIAPVREEIEFLKDEINKIKDNSIRETLYIILSRTVRSCRATTHADLATLKEPIFEPYYCRKHSKICKPLFTISNWWERYTKDTLKRLSEFDRLRTDTYQLCIAADSRTVNIVNEVNKINPEFARLIEKQKIAGIFSFPPYVGLIDYHEQHAYAYELFGFARRDDKEIGPLFKGQGKEARQSYVEGIAQVLKNIKPFLREDYNIFLVANDKYNLYPQIAELSGMQIVNQYKRPVLNRVEKNRKTAYAEIIFHLKEQ